MILSPLWTGRSGEEVGDAACDPPLHEEASAATAMAARLVERPRLLPLRMRGQAIRRPISEERIVFSDHEGCQGNVRVWCSSPLASQLLEGLTHPWKAVARR